MSEKLNLREKLHIGEKRTGGEKPRMSKKLKKAIIIAACAVGVCGAVWGGLTIARNAQRSDVKVYSVNDFCMTDYWGDTSSTSGMVTTDKIQKVFLSSSQTVNKVWVAEGDSVRKGDKLISYDSTLTQASVEQAKIDYDRQDESLTTAKNELEYLKKAKNKETLEKEKASLEAELETEIGKIDKDTGYDPKSPVVPGRIAVTDSTGNDETHPMYYQLLQADTLLSEAKLRAILHGDGTQPGLGRLEPKPAEEGGKTSISTYVVLVTRDKDMIGGLPESQGYLLVETYVPAVVDENGNEVTPAATTISFQPYDLPEYVDPGRTYDTENYKRIQRKLNIVNMYLESSMEQKDLAKAIVDKAQEVKEKEVNLRLAKLSLDKKTKELGDGNVYAEFDGTVKAVRNADEAYNNSEAVIELSGGGGYYVTGTLSEMELGSVKVGDHQQLDDRRSLRGHHRIHRRLPHHQRQQLGRRQQKRVLLPLQGVRGGGCQPAGQRLCGYPVPEGRHAGAGQQPVSAKLVHPHRQRQELRHGAERGRQAGAALGADRPRPMGQLYPDTRRADHR